MEQRIKQLELRCRVLCCLLIGGVAAVLGCGADAVRTAPAPIADAVDDDAEEVPEWAKEFKLPADARELGKANDMTRRYRSETEGIIYLDGRKLAKEGIDIVSPLSREEVQVIEYRNGRANGIDFHYTPQFIRITQMRNGRKHGREIIYEPSLGNPKDTSEWEDGKHVGN